MTTVQKMHPIAFSDISVGIAKRLGLFGFALISKGKRLVPEEGFEPPTKGL